jgi:hypothetical protein
VALALAALSPVATAQTSADKAAAEALFQAGRDLMTAGKFDEACAKFEASQHLDSGLGTLLYLADCYEKAGRIASAWATFREAESIAGGRDDHGRAEVAKQRYTALEPRLSKLSIKVADGNDPATEVRRDGEMIPKESWGIALPMDPGEHTIEASAPGRKPWSSKAVIQGDAQNVPVEVPVLEAAPVEAPKSAPPPPAAPVSSPPQADAPPARDGSGQRTLGLVVGGVGVVGLGVGTYFGLRAKKKNNDSFDHCLPNDHNQCDQNGVDLRNSAKSSAGLSTAFMIGGGLVLATGVVVYLTAPSSSPRTGSISGLRVTAGVGPNDGRVAFEGAF